MPTERYPYQHRVTLNNSNGMAVMSRFPIASVEELATSTNALRVELDMDGGARDAVRDPSAGSDRFEPDRDLDRGLRRDPLARLCDRVRGRSWRATSTPAPATSRSGHLASTCDLRDANDVAGGGFGATWPLARRFPPLMRLDHVMVADGLGIEGIGVIPSLGSDHEGSGGPDRADLTGRPTGPT